MRTATWFVLTAPVFSTKYRLTTLGDRKGNTLSLAYALLDPFQLAAVTDNHNRTVQFAYAGSRISAASFFAADSPVDTCAADPTHCRKISYTYAADQLTSVTDAYGDANHKVAEQRTTGYGYPDGVLKTVTDARGGVTTFSYAAGKLSNLSDRATKDWIFTSGAGCPAESGSAGAICLEDPEGSKQTYSRNSAGNLVALKDGGDKDLSGNSRQNTTRFEWFDSGPSKNRIHKALDQKGNETVYGWTPKGSLRTATREGGNDAPLTTTFYYYPDPIAGTLDPDPDDPAVTDAAADVDPLNLGWEDMTRSTTGDRVQLYYPRLKSASPGEKTPLDGTLRRVLDAETNATDFYYHAGLTGPNRSGLLARIVDAMGHETKYGNTVGTDPGYDPSGSPKTITDARGNPALYEFDFLGRTNKTVDREVEQWLASFDLRGNLLSAKNPENEIVRYCYDQNDNLKLVVPARSPQAPSCNSAGDDSTLNGTDGYSTKLTYDARDLAVCWPPLSLRT